MSNDTVDAATFSLLPRISSSPEDVAALNDEQMATLAQELRNKIIGTVSKNGGHLAPSLGVVELTLALLRCFNPAEDKFVWDVGHQAYAYKLLTGRFDDFDSLRQLGGVCGFPKPDESPYDHFGVGHSSTSISAGLGMAMARDLAKKHNKVISIIGDGSLTAGLSFEGLNQAGHMGRDLIVVLNDNEMSIAPNVGALSSFLSRNMSKSWVMKMKKEAESIVKQIPGFGQDIKELMRKTEGSVKGFFTPGMLFEAFKFNYLGPIDGHNLEDLTNVFTLVKSLKGPVLVHVLTKKGKGYAPAEENPSYYHGVGSFTPETGKAAKFKEGQVVLPSYTEIFGKTLMQLAEKDDRVVAITAAMPEGTGLTPFSQKFPEQFVDVGICEQHAVTFAGGLAIEGRRPFVAIYSTFLQRSYDQILHDVCLQNLPVVFCLDRGGLVGEDGATHHGTFDFSFLRHMPNITVMAPKNEPEMQDMLYTAYKHEGPIALRYPRGVGTGAPLKETLTEIPIGTGELLREGKDGVIITVGSRVYPSLAAADELAQEKGLETAVFNARFIKPLPEQQILDMLKEHSNVLFVEENVLAGGFSSAVLEMLADNDAMSGLRVKRLGLPDCFVEHGPQKVLRQRLGLDKNGVKASLLELLTP